MPKRKAQKKIERYRLKIQRLEEKEKQRSCNIINPSSDDDNYQNDETEAYNEIEQMAQVQNETIDRDVDIIATQNTIPQLEPTLVEPGSTLLEPTMSQAPEGLTEFELDPELVAALGASTSDAPEFGENVHQSLAQLWLPLLRKGLQKDSKEKFIHDYLIPDNCRLLQAPKLNAEISVATTDMIRNRDKKLLNMQQQLGTGITAINRAMDGLLKGMDKTQVLAHLSNSCRLLSDLHYMFNEYRIKLIMYGLDKSFSRVVENSERDDTLFGNSLSEKIKATKTIEKQGLQLKKTMPTQKPPGPSGHTPRAVPQQGNWTGPPRYSSNREGRGGQQKRFSSGGRRQYGPPPPPPPSQARTNYQNRQRAPTRPHH